MISRKNVANAVGGKTARACDSCIKKRARWYCAADDAFLCQSCDSSVHSANSLARRHERVRLKTASLKSLKLFSNETATSSFPSWHQGFTRKARTPRHGKAAVNLNSEKLRNHIIPFVPEVGSDETSHEENEEEQLLHRVPIFDPFADLCTSTTLSNEAEETITQDQTVGGEFNGIESKAPSFGLHGEGFMPSDVDLEEFAADVESLLGRGLENECFGMEELGLVDRKEEKLSLGKVKIEDEKEEKEFNLDTEIDMAREPPFEFNFDYDSATCGEDEEKVDFNKSGGTDDDEKLEKSKKRKILLRLDYEAVISAWASQGSPWTTGDRPGIDPDCWPDCMGICGTEVVHNTYGDQIGAMAIQPAIVDGGREARVSRYREKRRTRLFSKKIRYEVRKLNAEKRPRIKGRFVKRANFSAPAANFPLHVKLTSNCR